MHQRARTDRSGGREVTRVPTATGPERGPLGSVEYSTSWRRIIEPTGPTLSGAIDAATRCAKDGRKLDEERRMPGAGLSCSTYQEGPV
jgi:hypothetical protein